MNARVLTLVLLMLSTDAFAQGLVGSKGTRVGPVPSDSKLMVLGAREPAMLEQKLTRSIKAWSKCVDPQGPLAAVKFRLDATGAVVDPKVSPSTGSEEVDDCLLKALKKARFDSGAAATVSYRVRSN